MVLTASGRPADRTTLRTEFGLTAFCSSVLQRLARLPMNLDLIGSSFSIPAKPIVDLAVGLHAVVREQLDRSRGAVDPASAPLIGVVVRPFPALFVSGVSETDWGYRPPYHLV